MVTNKLSKKTYKTKRNLKKTIKKKKTLNMVEMVINILVLMIHNQNYLKLIL